MGTVSVLQGEIHSGDPRLSGLHNSVNAPNPTKLDT